MNRKEQLQFVPSQMTSGCCVALPSPTSKFRSPASIVRSRDVIWKFSVWIENVDAQWALLINKAVAHFRNEHFQSCCMIYADARHHPNARFHAQHNHIVSYALMSSEPKIVSRLHILIIQQILMHAFCASHVHYATADFINCINGFRVIFMWIVCEPLSPHKYMLTFRSISMLILFVKHLKFKPWTQFFAMLLCVVQSHC